MKKPLAAPSYLGSTPKNRRTARPGQLRKMDKYDHYRQALKKVRREATGYS